VTRPLALLAACAALSIGAGHAAAAEVERFAVVIGNDRGAAGETPLRYAETDAAKIAQVLQDVGGFAPENVIVLRGGDAAAALRAIIAINERVRVRSGRGADTELLVYYSGHGDRISLHLGPSRLDLHALEQLVRGSAATVRLLVVDACHSGALTRVKGGRAAPRMELDLGGRLYGEGIVFLTSSSASEAAQESDELRSSFFTHFLASGLLGAADSNQDGVVVLKEAYRHAYENTIRASSRTEAGIQHPTFRYELGGQGDIVLSRLRLGRQRAIVRLPPGRDFLLLERDADGPVLAEVGAEDRARALALKPGRYFVRGRGPDHLLEGSIDLGPGADVTVDVDSLVRVDYARLVRKGTGPIASVHGPMLGYQVRTPIVKGASPCQGPFASYGRDQSRLRLAARLAACRGGYDDADLSAHTDELSLSARVAIATDTRLVTLDAGAALGASYLRQSFQPSGEAATRNSAAAFVELGGTLIRYLPEGFYLSAELAGLGYVLPVRSGGNGRVISVRLAARIGLAAGLQF
jgi:hypothetical protein